jgi:hypothetical protein
MEDEKQLRILNQMFIPLSQAMPAMAAAQDPQMLAQAARAMQYIIARQIELSGSASAKQLGLVFDGEDDAAKATDQKIAELEAAINGSQAPLGDVLLMNETALMQMQEQMTMLRETQQVILEKLGASPVSSGSTGAIPEEPPLETLTTAPMVSPASA